MNTKIKISIVIPIYNCEKTIIELLESIESQTLRDYEVILVNDGSTDKTQEKIDLFCKNKPNYKLLSQKNQGAPAARNNGLSVAEGEYIYLCDSDDLLFPETLKAFYFKALETNADIVVGKKVSFNDGENKINASYEIIKNRFNRLNEYKYYVCDPVPGTKLFRRSFIEKNEIRFTNVRIGQDLNFYLKSIALTDRIALLDVDVYKYRVSDTGISRTYKVDNLLDIKKVFDNVYEFHLQHNKVLNTDEKQVLEFVKISNYLYQMRKGWRLTKEDNLKLRNELFKDISLKGKLKYKYISSFYMLLVDYISVKYFHFIIKKI